VGTVKAHPHVWIIVGLFYPRKEPAMNLEVEKVKPRVEQPTLLT
jgi:hypothetical protein